TSAQTAEHTASMPANGAAAQGATEPSGSTEPGRSKRRRRRRGRRGGGAAGGQEVAQAQLVPVEGVLDTDVKGQNAYLRNAAKNFLPSPEDPEIPKHLVQKLRLRPGSLISAQAVNRGKLVVQRVDAVDGLPPEEAWNRPDFSSLTVIDPVRRIRLETTPDEYTTRVIDLIAPIGFGQRALIVAPPKTGKTIMLQRIAQAITKNHPDAYL